MNNINIVIQAVGDPPLLPELRDDMKIENKGDGQRVRANREAVRFYEEAESI